MSPHPPGHWDGTSPLHLPRRLAFEVEAGGAIIKKILNVFQRIPEQEWTYSILGPTRGWMHLFGGEGRWIHSTLGGPFYFWSERRAGIISPCRESERESNYSSLSNTPPLEEGGADSFHPRGEVEMDSSSWVGEKKWTHSLSGSPFYFWREQRGGIT